MSVQIKGVGTIGGIDQGLDTVGVVTATSFVGTGVSVVGVITATSFVGSGANLTGITGTTINNNSANRIVTGSGSANTLEGNSNFTYTGSVVTHSNPSGLAKLDVKGDVSGGALGASISVRNTNSANNGSGEFQFQDPGSNIFAKIAGVNLTDGSNNGYMTFHTSSATSGLVERLRIGDAGQIGIAGANYGTAGQVLTSQGSGSAVQWANAGITMLDQWTLNNNYEVNGGETNLTADKWSRTSHALVGNIGGAMTVSSGVFTFPTTGIYLIIATFTGQPQSSSSTYAGMKIQGTTDNFSSSDVLLANNYDSSSGNTDYATVTVMTTFDCTNTSTHKIRFRSEVQNNFRWGGGQGKGPVFIRIGDT